MQQAEQSGPLDMAKERTMTISDDDDDDIEPHLPSHLRPQVSGGGCCCCCCRRRRCWEQLKPNIKNQAVMHERETRYHQRGLSRSRLSM